MFLVWTLSSLILSYTLGVPTLNSTSSGSEMKTFLNVTEENSTDYSKTNQTRSRGPGCSLATCATQNLGHRMQTGYENAGGSASDPWGPGKK
uniref:Calcitonin peptide-like domain-containing protein n=1 Tax=Sinocyclocheilus rhinocerous TaxID=307959 RepID=A0A673HX51_9TELE